MEENKKSKIEATIKTMLYKQAKDKIIKEEEELSYRKLHNSTFAHKTKLFFSIKP